MIAGTIAVSITALWSAAGAAVAHRLSTRLAPATSSDAAAAFLLAAAAGDAALAVNAGLAGAIACSGLTSAAILDARSGYLVDELTLSTAALALGFALVGPNAASALIGMTTLAGLAALTNLISRVAPLGWGYVKAFLALGAGLGLERAGLALGIACLFGLVAAALTRRREVRFGPHLAVGAVVALGGGA